MVVFSNSFTVGNWRSKLTFRMELSSMLDLCWFSIFGFMFKKFLKFGAITSLIFSGLAALEPPKKGEGAKKGSKIDSLFLAGGGGLAALEPPPL